jgi:uncharacterized protein (DUF1501 family)
MSQPAISARLLAAALDRRALLLGTLGVAGVWGLRTPSFAEQFAPTPARARGRKVGTTLVVLQLSGGNDGLSTLVPFGDDAYGRARDATRVEDVLRLDDVHGLHPGLERLHALYQAGGLALVQGAGYPNPNRSHFKSMDIWHTADERGRGAGDGWIARLARAGFGADAPPETVVHVGTSLPYALHSAERPAISFSAPEGYRWAANERELGELADGEAREEEEGALGFVRGVMKEAKASSARVRAAAARYRSDVAYPRDEFGDALRASAALVHAGIGCRVISLELGGFDTHNDQKRRHDGLMRTLDHGLSALLEDLQRSEAGRSTTVLAFSEFGRRVAENGSRGTDHGTAGPMLVAGEGIRGGLYGAAPSLGELDEGDLIHTTDFRRAYATVIHSTFGLAPEVALGKAWPTLPFA